MGVVGVMRASSYRLVVWCVAVGEAPGMACRRG